MGAWFTPRPGAAYRARWTGDNLAELAADEQLPDYLVLTVREDGQLGVTSVLGTSLVVPVGGWFTPTQWWTDDQLRAEYQELAGAPGVSRFTYSVETEVVTGT